MIFLCSTLSMFLLCFYDFSMFSLLLLCFLSVSMFSMFLGLLMVWLVCVHFLRGGLKSRLGVGNVWLLEPHLLQLLLNVVGGDEQIKVVGGVLNERWRRWPQPPHPTPDRAFTDPPTRPPAHTHTFPQ